MPISKGGTWGEHRPFSTGTPIANSNRALHTLIAAGHGTVGLLGGDLHRTVGGASAGERILRNDPSNLPVHLPIDLIEVVLDDEPAGVFAAHLVGHDRFWHHIVAAMNADFWRRYQLGPRAHPNDGVIDVYRAFLRTSDLVKVAPRARTGTHVPHPSIELSRNANVELEFPKPLRFRADDVSVGSGSRIRLTVRPDALTVVV